MTPTLQSSAFSDHDLFDTHTASQWQISTEPGDYSNPVFDSDRDTSHRTSISIPSGTLTYSTTYYWHVRHSDWRNRWSSYSKETSFTTIGQPTVPPTVVTDEAAEVSSDFAKLKGTLESLGTALQASVSFEWDISSGSHSNETTSQSMMSTGAFYFELSGLSPSTTYYFRAKATGDETAYGVEMSFTTSAPSNQPPSIPSNVSPANAAAGITLTPTLQSSAFSDPNTGDTHAASQWQVRTTSGSYSSPVYDSGTNASQLTTITIPALNYSTTYYWHVCYSDSEGNWSEWSAETSFTTISELTAPLISGVTAINVGNTRATITWNTDVAASSQVQYGLTTAYETSSILDLNLVTSHSVDLTSLSPLKTYHYRVRSSDAAGNPVFSADFAFTTADVAPGVAPVVSDDGEHTADLTQLHASWSSTGASVVAEYLYAIGTTRGGTDVVNWTSAGANAEVTKTGLVLSDGTTYYFSVKAKTSQGLWSEAGTSDGIVARPGASGGDSGAPPWTWIFLGVGAVAGLAALAYLVLHK